MTASRIPSDRAVIEEPSHEADRTVHEAPAVALSIQCQPYAGAGGNDIMWPGTISDISAEGILLLLERRFEPRTMLSVSLPEIDSCSTSRAIARVTHVERHGDGAGFSIARFSLPSTRSNSIPFGTRSRGRPLQPRQTLSPRSRLRRPLSRACSSRFVTAALIRSAGRSAGFMSTARGRSRLAGP